MADKLIKTRFKPSRKTFIREWREYRGYTLEELGEIMGCTAGAISNVERMASGYTQGMLEALASALNCSEADLLTRSPQESPSLEVVISNATAEQREKIRRLANIVISEDAA